MTTRRDEPSERNRTREYETSDTLSLLRQVAEIPLQDENRRTVVRSVANQVSPQSVVEILVSDDRLLATAAGEVLVAIGERGVKVLCSNALGDDERRAILATTTLGLIDGSAADTAVIAVLKESTNVNVLHAAIDAAARKNLSSTIPLLEEIAARDEWLKMGVSFALSTLATKKNATAKGKEADMQNDHRESPKR